MKQWYVALLFAVLGWAPALGCSEPLTGVSVEELDRRLRTPLSGDEYFAVYLSALDALAAMVSGCSDQERPAMLALVRRGTYGGWDSIAIATLRQNPRLQRALLDP